MIASVLAGIARLIAGSTVFWSEPPTKDPKIYVANHSSHLDFIVLWSFLPPPVRAVTRPVAAKDYWSKGIRRFLAERAFHALLIDRGRGAAALLPAAELPPVLPTPRGEVASGSSHKAVEYMAAALDEGSSLILFPEGTRSRDGELGPFRSGLYFLCHERPQIPVVPVYMSNLNRILPKGAVLPVPLLSRIFIGTPLHLAPDETKEEFLTRARAAVADLTTA